jgi:hypothetical protein
VRHGWRLVEIERRGLEYLGRSLSNKNKTHIGGNLPKLEVLAPLERELLLGLA